MLRVSPAARFPSVHGKLAQLPVAETKDKPGGAGSSSTASVASEGPSLPTTMVYVTFVFDPVDCGPVLVTKTSAAGTRGIVVWAAAAPSGPAPSGSTRAVLVRSPLASGFTRTSKRTRADAPAATWPAGAPELLTRAPDENGIAPATSGTATPFRVVLPATYVVPAG